MPKVSESCDADSYEPNGYYDRRQAYGVYKG